MSPIPPIPPISGIPPEFPRREPDPDGDKKKKPDKKPDGDSPKEPPETPEAAPVMDTLRAFASWLRRLFSSPEAPKPEKDDDKKDDDDPPHHVNTWA